ncbi:MAG: hypothetical protein ACD_56C00083G0006 [uncultured bacterium]|nr:MAG: hypothetical protein ACD_56C00083G0006 [uncultured bacterium]
MFHLIKFIIWVAGIALIAYIALPYFGYEVNMNYFKESKGTCQQRVSDCSKQIVEQGTKNATCDLNCVDPKIIIQKK